MTRAAMVAVGVAWLLAACGSSDSDDPNGSTHDASHDALADVKPASDGGAGSSGAAGADASDDIGSEASLDAGTDASSDAAIDAPSDAHGDGGPPNAYAFYGTASGVASDGSESVECLLTIFFQNVIYDGAGGWGADMVGEVFRTITAGDKKYEFQALIGVEGKLTSSAAGVELILSDKPTSPTDKPFWLELQVLKGTQTAAYAWAGNWTCAPLMIDQPGWKDMKTTAPGTWTLKPDP